MWKFYYQDKIFAVWLEDRLPVIDMLDIYDAGPDGLSGLKEGFYFAGSLYPFVIPVIINGITLTPDCSLPCSTQESSPCERCHLFSRISCPLLKDIENIELSQRGFKAYSTVTCVPKGNLRIFEVALKELLRHGKPLHYHALSRILESRYPNIQVTERKLSKTLKLNPIFFQPIEDGVFMAVNRPYKDASSLIELYCFDFR